MTIDNLMQDRAALTAQIEAIQPDQSIDETFRRRWQLEEVILGCHAMTIDEIKVQLRILADRARDGADVALDLERLAR
jgi:hypothetical protein